MGRGRRHDALDRAPRRPLPRPDQRLGVDCAGEHRGRPSPRYTSPGPASSSNGLQLPGGIQQQRGRLADRWRPRQTAPAAGELAICARGRSTWAPLRSIARIQFSQGQQFIGRLQRASAIVCSGRRDRAGGARRRRIERTGSRRSRRAAAAASPPRPWARHARRSSSAATDVVGPGRRPLAGVPGPAIRILARDRGALGQRPVHRPAVGRLAASVDRRPGPAGGETACRGRAPINPAAPGRRAALQADPPVLWRRAREQATRITDRIRRDGAGDEYPLAWLDSGREGLLDLPGPRPSPASIESRPCTSAGGDMRGTLQQGQRVPRLSAMSRSRTRSSSRPAEPTEVRAGPTSLSDRPSEPRSAARQAVDEAGAVRDRRGPRTPVPPARPAAAAPHETRGSEPTPDRATGRRLITHSSGADHRRRQHANELRHRQAEPESDRALRLRLDRKPQEAHRAAISRSSSR